ncbi:MAG: hypothetical protein H0T75_13320 [Rhizobiales bacterium]|jgi:hypothetical protein|nr:hypothetical protein [Hyphomicrobiales bacterium]MDQ3558580.1 hypothetical protein [Pseudomonadota bacterium]
MSSNILDRRQDVRDHADPSDIAVAQFLDLARAANVTFELVDDRLVMRSARANWKQWQPLRRCLDEIGIEAIAEYFRATTPEDRAILSAAAA